MRFSLLAAPALFAGVLANDCGPLAPGIACYHFNATSVNRPVDALYLVLQVDVTKHECPNAASQRTTGFQIVGATSTWRHGFTYPATAAAAGGNAVVQGFTNCLYPDEQDGGAVFSGAGLVWQGVSPVDHTAVELWAMGRAAGADYTYSIQDQSDAFSSSDYIGSLRLIDARPPATTTASLSSSTTTTTSTTSTSITTGLPTCAKNLCGANLTGTQTCYHLVAGPSGNNNDVANAPTAGLDAYLTVDDAVACGASGMGRAVVGMRGVFGSVALTYSAADTYQSATQCFFPDALDGGVFDYGGVSFIGGDGQEQNLYYEAGAYYLVNPIIDTVDWEYTAQLVACPVSTTSSMPSMSSTTSGTASRSTSTSMSMSMSMSTSARISSAISTGSGRSSTIQSTSIRSNGTTVSTSPRSLASMMPTTMTTKGVSRTGNATATTRFTNSTSMMTSTASSAVLSTSLPTSATASCGVVGPSQRCYLFSAKNLAEPARLPIDFFIVVDVPARLPVSVSTTTAPPSALPPSSSTTTTSTSTLNFASFAPFPVREKRQVTTTSDAATNKCLPGGQPIVRITGVFDGTVIFPAPISTSGVGLTPDDCFYPDAVTTSVFSIAGTAFGSTNTVDYLIQDGDAHGNASPGLYWVSGTSGFGEWYGQAVVILVVVGPSSVAGSATTTMLPSSSVSLDPGMTISTVFTTRTLTVPCPVCAPYATVTVTTVVDVLYTTVCPVAGGNSAVTGAPAVGDAIVSTVYTTLTSTVYCAGAPCGLSTVVEAAFTTTVVAASTPAVTAVVGNKSNALAGANANANANSNFNVNVNANSNSNANANIINPSLPSIPIMSTDGGNGNGNGNSQDSTMSNMATGTWTTASLGGLSVLIMALVALEML